MKHKFIEWLTKNNNGCTPVMADDRSFVREKTQHMFEAYLAGVAEGEAKCAALAAESEERRQFILNGVEFGFIRLPDEDTADSAKEIYGRCLSVGKYEPCQKCNDTGMTDSGGTQPWGEPIEIECDCLAAQLRKGAQS